MLTVKKNLDFVVYLSNQMIITDWWTAQKTTSNCREMAPIQTFDGKTETDKWNGIYKDAIIYFQNDEKYGSTY